MGSNSITAQAATGRVNPNVRTSNPNAFAEKVVKGLDPVEKAIVFEKHTVAEYSKCAQHHSKTSKGGQKVDQSCKVCKGLGFETVKDMLERAIARAKGARQ